MTDDEFAQRLDLFFGQASDALCYVYAQLTSPPPGNDWQLTGSLRGPSCSIAATLPATHALVPLAPGESLLARAVVPEPSFWTPELPHVYQAEVTLRQGERAVASTRRLFGIRTLGSAGSKLIYGGKRWVLRGVCTDELPHAADWKAWHEMDTAALVNNPSDALCQEASLQGVLLVARLEAEQLGELARLSCWPAVGIVVVRGAADASRLPRRHNLVLAQQVGLGAEPAPGAKVVVLELPDYADATVAPLPAVATLALRRAAGLASVAEGRAACDRLQRDLAARPAGPRGDWAGFVV